MKKLWSRMFGCVLLCCFFILPVSVTAGFSDIIPSYPYYEAINQLEKEGIISGYADGTFQAFKKINRVEALKIILLGSKINVPVVEHNADFFDVEKNSWFAKYVYTAKKLGVVKGNPDGSFAPERTINLAEALKVIIHTNQFPIDLLANESPYPNIPTNSWFAMYFLYAKENNFFVNYDQNIVPYQEITRGDLAEFMYRASLHKKDIEKKTMHASFYSDIFNGRKTSNREIFDNEKFTAAHRTIPMGTKIKATNPINNKSVIVVINDRGPYHPFRVLDLSKAAFLKLAPLSRGVIPIEIEILDNQGNEFIEVLFRDNKDVPIPDTFCEYPPEREFLETNSFDDIFLFHKIPKHFLTNEIFIIRGRVNSKTNIEKISVFLKDKNDLIESFTMDTDNNVFSIPVLFDKTGDYRIGIIKGFEGVSNVYPIQVIDRCPKELLLNQSLMVPVWNFDIQDNKVYLKFKKSSENLLRVLLFQGSSKVDLILNNTINEVPLPPKLFRNFIPGEAYLQIGTAESKSLYSTDQKYSWNFSDIKNIDLVHQFYDSEDEYYFSSIQTESFYLPNTKIHLTGKTKKPLRSDTYLILPGGEVEETSIKSDTSPRSLSSDYSYFPSGSTITFEHKITVPGVYTISLYNKEGQNVLNHTYYPANSVPLIPDPLNFHDEYDVQKNTSIDMESLRKEMLLYINEDRAALGLNPVNLNKKMINLAQARSDDMVENNYFSHYNSKNESVNDIRLSYGVSHYVTENIARDVNIRRAELSLMHSALHRKNIITPAWTQVGIGIQKDTDGTLVITQLFSEDPIKKEDINDVRKEILNFINNKRLEKNLTKVIPDKTLELIAQNWTNKMVEENFFGFTSTDDQTELLDYVSDKEIYGEIGRYILYDNSLSHINSTIENHAEIFEADWDKIGIGIAQDNEGIIKITILYLVELE